MSNESIQLIYKNKNNGLLHVNEEALNLFRKLTGKISICVLVGPYRQGKSYLLNRLINDTKNTFKVSHMDDSCTKGIWINREPIKINRNYKEDELNVFYADTEGLESDDCDEAWDTKLFLLSLSISSVFIYNTKNALTNDSFKKLSVMVKLSDRIKLNSNSHEKYQSILNNECPDFVWIVRDFSLIQQIQPNERLKKFLELENITEGNNNEKKIEEIKARNEIKKSFKKYFSNLNCFYMCTPEQVGKSLNETLRNLDSIHIKELSNDFQNDMKNINDFLKNNLKPKMINNQKLTGYIFAEYLKNIINFINNDQVINLHDTVLASVKNVASTILDQVKSDYLKIMDLVLSKNNLPLKWQEFYSKENKINSDCIKFIQSNLSSNHSICNEYLSKFQDFKNDKLINYKKINEKEAFNFNQNEFNKIKQNYIDEMKNYMRYNEAKKWADFNQNEARVFRNCISQISDNLIFDKTNNDVKKYENDFMSFKEVKYNGKLVGGKLYDFYKENEKYIDQKNRKESFDLWNNMNMRREFKSVSDFNQSVDEYKNKLRNNLFEISDFNTYWNSLSKELNIDTIRMNIKPEATKATSMTNYERIVVPLFGGLKIRSESPSSNNSRNYRDSPSSSDDDDDESTCYICGRKFASSHGVAVHVGKMHK